MIKNYTTYIKENIDDLDYEEEEDFDDSFITDDEFRQFLIDNNCLEEYVENIENENTDPYRNFNFENAHRSEYINLAFNWANTPQGDPYWENLDIVWCEKDLGINNYYSKY